jgi:hypothetical protein
MNTPPIITPTLIEMLPMPMMFLYGCLRQGQVNVDRENKVINIIEGTQIEPQGESKIILDE